MRQDIPWSKFAIEAIVIVGSILLAFAIDAWWEERQDRNEERVALSRLHNEFQSSTARLGSSETRLAAATEIYNLLQSHQEQDLPLSIPNSLIVPMLGVPTFDRVTPVLDGLIQSGNLSLIQNQEVLSSIAVWQRDIIQLSESQQDARRVTYEILIPALSERGNLGKPLSSAQGRVTDAQRRARLEAITGESSLHIDNEIIGLVADRIRHIEGTIRSVETLRSSTQSVISAIEQAEGY